MRAGIIQNSGLERSTALVAGFFLLLASGVAAYSWHGGTAGFLFDDALYLLMADFFSPYVDTNPHLQAFVMEQSRFPPGLPLVIALLGGGSQNMEVAHLIAGGTFVASAAAYYVWMRGLSVPMAPAVGAVVVFTLLPKTLHYLTEIWSEYLYLTFVFAALLFAERARQASRRTQELLLASALCIALSMLTRTVGVVLFASFVLLIIPLPTKRKILSIVVCIVPYCFWLLVKAMNGYNGTYIEDLDRYTDWAGIAALLTVELPRKILLIGEAWNRNLGIADDSAKVLVILSSVLLMLALLGLGQRLAQRRIDGYYVVLYVGLIVVWPYPDHMTRFMYPLMPFGIAYAVTGVSWVTSWLARGAGPPHGISAVVLAAALLLGAPNVAFVAERFLDPLPQSVPEDFRKTRYWLRGDNLERVKYEIERRGRVIALLKRIGDQVPADQCIYSPHSPFTMLYTQRVSIRYAKSFSVDQLQQCDYFLAMNLGTGHFPPMYPAQRLTQDGFARVIDVARDSRGNISAVLLKRVPRSL